MRVKNEKHFKTSTFGYWSTKTCLKINSMEFLCCYVIKITKNEFKNHKIFILHGQQATIIAGSSLH